jgi:phosphosulfolactate synthase (CoM biosynthesis protein A)
MAAFIVRACYEDLSESGINVKDANDDRAFSFLRVNGRPPKPRKVGLTEIRGPYYTPIGKRYLEDVLETMGAYVDALKFAGGSFTLMPRSAVKELIDLCHKYQVLVSTGGFLEHVLQQGPEAVRRYIQECKDLGFDIIEISCGFITIPTDDWLRLVVKVKEAGLRPKPEIGVNSAPAARLRPRNWRRKGRGIRNGPFTRQNVYWMPALT